MLEIHNKPINIYTNCNIKYPPKGGGGGGGHGNTVYSDDLNI